MKSEFRSDLVFNLNELHRDGESFQYTRQTGELNAVLKDLIPTADYSIELTILPLGDAYQLNGSITTKLDLLCSRCAVDIQNVLNVQINVLLMIDDSSDYSNGSQSRQNAITENPNELFCHTIENSFFNIGEFMHENIAINIPYQPLGSEDCLTSCENYNEAIRKGWVDASHQDTGDLKQTHRPFKSLKNIKLNS